MSKYSIKALPRPSQQIAHQQQVLSRQEPNITLKHFDFEPGTSKMPRPDTSNCTEISVACPVEYTVYGYYPGIGPNAYAVAVFAVCFVVNIGLGWRYRQWTYMIAMSLACIVSAGGYGGRIGMHDNPWSSNFEVQIVLLTIAPAFNSAAIYLMLKHIVLRFGPEWSRIKPKFYTYAFISADILALVLQGAGGGIAATADDDDPDMLEAGDNLLIAGISWQVVTLAVFGAMIADFVFRRVRSPTPLSSKASQTWRDIKFRIFAGALALLYTMIIIRCIYRIAEMAGGWRNSIMQDESLFIGLDTVMMTIATLLQTFIHPGIFFPAIAEPHFKEKRVDESDVGQAA